MSQDITTTDENARLKIALAANGRTDVSLSVKDIPWDQFCRRLSVPKVGQKDGSYYVRGGDLVEPRRADENLKEADLCIIDGDSSFDPETGEIQPGAPPLPDAIAAMQDIGVGFFAHTTHSFDPTNNLWKYRILIPARMKSPAELDAVVTYLVDQLHARGVFITDVPENRRWSQPWYMPRVGTQEAVSAFKSHRHDGPAMDVAKAVAWHKERKQRQAVEQHISTATPTTALMPGDPPSAIDAFNNAHDLAWVRSTLEGQGYKFVYCDPHGPGGEAYRYIRPGSTSGTAGVVVFKGAYGHWCVFSHHGIEDPLSSKLTDPFDLYATFSHNGDRKAALRAIRPPEPTIAEQINAKHQPAPRASTEVVTSPAEPKPRIHLIMAQELKDEPITWLIDQLLPAKGFGALYGKPGSYKSFCALYLASAIANGTDAFARSTNQGDVVYLAGEGGAGLKRRWDACRQHHNLPDSTPIAFVKAQLNLRSTMEDAEALIQAIKDKGLTPKLLVVDTLARAFAGGNENSSEDMGAFISIVGALQDALSCAILIVHHSGKDEAKGQRGHSSLLGAVDAELEVTKISDEDSPERIGKLKVTKQKDGEDGIEIGYRMVTVQLSSLDPDATSLALEPLNGPMPTTSKPAKLTGNTADALSSLRKAIANHGEQVSSNHIPFAARCVKESTWRTYFYQETTADGDGKRQAFKRAKQTLKDRNLATNQGEIWWVTDSSERPF
jgi:hypothetical protein